MDIQLSQSPLSLCLRVSDVMTKIVLGRIQIDWPAVFIFPAIRLDRLRSPDLGKRRLFSEHPVFILFFVHFLFFMFLRPLAQKTLWILSFFFALDPLSHQHREKKEDLYFRAQRFAPHSGRNESDSAAASFLGPQDVFVQLCSVVVG